MEKEYDEIDLYQLYLTVSKRKWLIFFLVIISTAVVFCISSISPKIYEGVAILHVPLLPDTLRNSPTSESVSIISSVFRSIKEERSFPGLSSSVIEYIDDISATKIKDSEETIELRVRVRNDREKAKVIFNQLLMYLKANKFIAQELALEKASIEKKITETEKALEGAIKIKDQTIRLLENRNPVGFNPVDLEVNVNSLRYEIIDLKKKADILGRGYEFVQLPHVFEKPIKPRPLLHAMLGFLSSLVFGILLAFFLEWKEKINMSKT